MPHGLDYQGQKLWKSVTARFEIDKEPHKLRILFDACKTADLIQKLDKAANDAPLTVKGSMGQQVINPLIAQAEASRTRLSQMLVRLNFGTEDEED